MANVSAGDTFRQPELAATLKRIARNGAAEFYSGETAHAIVDDISRLGGLITPDDLAKYQPKVREVLRAKYDSNGHSWEVLTSPPLVPVASPSLKRSICCKVFRLRAG